MNKLISKIDIAYLPDKASDPIAFMDSVNPNELNKAYQFCNEHGARSFCTYPELLPCLESTSFKTKLCAVVDFPEGASLPEEKIFEAGRAYELCKRSSSGELDVVLEETTYGAEEDIQKFYYSGIYKAIGIKFIIELGNRDPEGVKHIVNVLNRYPNSVRYIKTNSGKLEPITFEQKIQYAARLQTRTSLPIKISGGVSSFEQIEKYLKVLGDKTIFGVGYPKITKF